MSDIDTAALSLALGILAIVLALGALALTQRNWLNIARIERSLAQRCRALEKPDEAERHEALAARYARRAWPFKDRRPSGDR